MTGSGSTIEGMTINNITNAVTWQFGSTKVSKVNDISSQTNAHQTSFGRMSDITAFNATLDIDGASLITNSGYNDLDIVATGAQISNSTFDAASTIGSTAFATALSNCTFNVSLAVDGDRTSITGGRYGDAAGGGGGTITVGATADKTTITGAMVDAVGGIVDGGTNTVETGTNIY